MSWKLGYYLTQQTLGHTSIECSFHAKRIVGSERGLNDHDNCLVPISFKDMIAVSMLGHVLLCDRAPSLFSNSEAKMKG